MYATVPSLQRKRNRVFGVAFEIPVVFELFVNTGYMHGIWVLAHRSGTHLLVRYEAWQRSDGLIEGRMELLGAGA